MDSTTNMLGSYISFCINFSSLFIHHFQLKAVANAEQMQIVAISPSHLVCDINIANIHSMSAARCREMQRICLFVASDDKTCSPINFIAHATHN